MIFENSRPDPPKIRKIRSIFRYMIPFKFLFCAGSFFNFVRGRFSGRWFFREYRTLRSCSFPRGKTSKTANSLLNIGVWETKTAKKANSSLKIGVWEAKTAKKANSSLKNGVWEAKTAKKANSSLKNDDFREFAPRPTENSKNPIDFSIYDSF